MSLLSSMADFVPCDRLLQKAYYASKHMERVVCQWEGNLLYFGDQIAFSHQIHKTDATNQSQRLKERKHRLSTWHKIRKRSDENISRKESFKKGKKKVVGERQKAY